MHGPHTNTSYWNVVLFGINKSFHLWRNIILSQTYLFVFLFLPSFFSLRLCFAMARNFSMRSPDFLPVDPGASESFAAASSSRAAARLLRSTGVRVPGILHHLSYKKTPMVTRTGQTMGSCISTDDSCHKLRRIVQITLSCMQVTTHR